MSLGSKTCNIDISYYIHVFFILLDQFLYILEGTLFDSRPVYIYYIHNLCICTDDGSEREKCSSIKGLYILYTYSVKYVLTFYVLCVCVCMLIIHVLCVCIVCMCVCVHYLCETLHTNAGADGEKRDTHTHTEREREREREREGEREHGCRI